MTVVLGVVVYRGVAVVSGVVKAVALGVVVYRGVEVVRGVRVVFAATLMTEVLVEVTVLVLVLVVTGVGIAKQLQADEISYFAKAARRASPGGSATEDVVLEDACLDVVVMPEYDNEVVLGARFPRSANVRPSEDV